MLSAVLNGKRRGSGLVGRDFLLGDAEGAEDLLTASVFERLAYLPDEVFKDLMSHLLGEKNVPGTLQEMTFWPSWERFNGRRVEPDVVLKCTERVVIVEAKRYDGCAQQYADQLANELSAAKEAEGIVRPILLAVGGMWSDEKEEADQLRTEVFEALSSHYEYDLIFVSWRQFYKALAEAVRKQSENSGLQRILKDVERAYDWHDVRYQEQRWLKDLKLVDIRIDGYLTGFDWFLGC